MLQNIVLFGHTINLYDFFNNAAYIVSILLAVYMRKHFDEAAALPKLADLYFNKKKSRVLHWAFIVINALVLEFIVISVNNLTGPFISRIFLGDTDLNFFPNIFCTPVVIFLFAVLLRSEPLATADCSAVITCGSLICYKIACFCWGCCYGVECEHCGMMNSNTGRLEFPIQLVEVACAAVMLAVLMVLARRKNPRKGLLYPLFMLMYCASRFVSDFWRGDYPAVYGPLTGYHVQCIVGLIEGALLLAVVLVWGGRITALFAAKNQAMLDRHAEKLRASSRKKNKK